MGPPNTWRLQVAPPTSAAMQRRHGVTLDSKHGSLHRVVRCLALLRKIGNNPARSHALRTLSLERLIAGQLTPERAVGPVEVSHIAGMSMTRTWNTHT